MTAGKASDVRQAMRVYSIGTAQIMKDPPCPRASEMTSRWDNDGYSPKGTDVSRSSTKIEYGQIDLFEDWIIYLDRFGPELGGRFPLSGTLSSRCR